MALGDEDLQKSKSSSSSSSGSSGRGGKCPQFLITETGEGLKGMVYPNTPQMTSDEIEARDKKVTWDEGFFKELKRIARDEYNEDLKKAIREDPERAINLINEVSKCIKNANSGINKKAQRYRSCAICGDSLYLVSNEYVRVGESKNKVVCNSHTAKDLANNDLI